MPGSPLVVSATPGTIPPPKTLLSSLSVVFNLGVLLVSISEIFNGFDKRSLEKEVEDFQSLLSGFCTTSQQLYSTIYRTYIAPAISHIERHNSDKKMLFLPLPLVPKFCLYSIGSLQ